MTGSGGVEGDTEAESRGIQSVEIAGRLIAALCRLPRDGALKQLSAMADMAPSKAHRYMASLVRTGLARQDESGRYSLGPLALRLGLAAIAQSDLIGAAGRATEMLAREIEASVHLNVWGDWGPVVIRLCQGRSPVISTVRLGSVLPLTRSATGLVYLAFAHPGLTGPLLAQEIAATLLPLDRESLDARIKRTREDRLGRVDGLLIPGLTAISSPMFDFQNELACAVTVTGTDPALTDPSGPVALRLRSVCTRLSEEFGSTVDRPIG